MERAKKIKEKITESSIPIFIWSGEKAKRNEEEKRKKQQTGKPIKTKERANPRHPVHASLLLAKWRLSTLPFAYSLGV